MSHIKLTYVILTLRGMWRLHMKNMVLVPFIRSLIGLLRPTPYDDLLISLVSEVGHMFLSCPWSNLSRDCLRLVSEWNTGHAHCVFHSR